MFQIQDQQMRRKSFLSPQNTKNYRTVMSPKFDKQKAKQQQIIRQIINEQKLNRYNYYNSILSQKAKKLIQPERNESNIQNHAIYTFNKKQSHHNNQYPRKSQPNQCMMTNKNQLDVYINKQIQVQDQQMKNYSFKGKNKKVNKKDLKSSYNNEFKQTKQQNTGGSQLQCILQQVEMTYNTLKSVNPQFKGLWLMSQNQHQQSYVNIQKQQYNKQRYQNRYQLKYNDEQKSQIHTKDTVDYDQQRRLPNKNGKSDWRSSLNYKNDQDYSIVNQNLKIYKIKLLQLKFNKLIQKINSRSINGINIDKQLHQLNAIQTQIDQLKKDKTSKMSNNLILNNSKSQKSVQLVSNNISRQNQSIKNLNKVKSLGRIIS